MVRILRKVESDTLSLPELRPLIGKMVEITIEEQPNDAASDWVKRTCGMMHWQGDAETLRRIAEDDEFGIAECP